MLLDSTHYRQIGEYLKYPPIELPLPPGEGWGEGASELINIKARLRFLAYAPRVFKFKEMAMSAPATSPTPAAAKVKLPIDRKSVV